jgi:protein phosphatase
VRLVGDVHGDAEAFAGALAGVRDHGLFVVQLGDLVDRGPDSPGALRRALDVLDRGEGLVLRGNHDDKLFRALQGNPVSVGDDLTATLASLDSAPDGKTLKARFQAAFAVLPWWLRLDRTARGTLLLVHGAFHPAMLDHTDPADIPSGRTRKKCQWLALHGEGHQAADGAMPTRTYGWVDTVPVGVTVVVGHDVRDDEAPLTVPGAGGGTAVFLDTGAGKGGRLSWIDMSVLSGAG